MCFVNQKTWAESSQREKAWLGHSFVAAGLLYGLGSFRIGHKKWELGLLGTGLLGFNKVLMMNKNFYAAFGPALHLSTSQLGVYGGVGLEFLSFSVFQLRVEAFGGLSFRNYSHAGLLAGVNIII